MLAWDGAAAGDGVAMVGGMVAAAGEGLAAGGGTAAAAGDGLASGSGTAAATGDGVTTKGGRSAAAAGDAATPSPAAIPASAPAPVIPPGGSALFTSWVLFLAAMELLFSVLLGQTEEEREALAGRVEAALARFRSHVVR